MRFRYMTSAAMRKKKDRRREAIIQMLEKEVWMLAVDNILPQETLSAPA